MSHILRQSLLILLLRLLGACGKNESWLRFSLAKDLSSNIRVVHYAANSRGGAMIESVASVMNGKGELRLVMHNPTLIYLYAGGNVPTMVYAERGDNITVAGSESNPNLWSIDGNEINEELSLWRNAHASTLFSGTQREINEAVADYVEGNPDNPVAAILMLTAYYRSENERQFVELWYSIGPKAEKERWVGMAGRSDMLHTRVGYPGKLHSMTMRSLANGIDTIRPTAADATILFFWNNGMERRKEYIDSLKVLAREFPDSAARIIADISLDADSVSWRSPLRNDSVKNIARFWAPAGLADLRLMDLQIPRTPFFSVIAPSGLQVYRGSDPAEAMKAFRRLAGTPGQ